MNRTQEQLIVKAFFEKRIQERVLHELSSPKKRLDALNRLCHSYSTTLRKKYLIELSKANFNKEDLENLLRKYGPIKQCYVISWNKDIDGKEMPLSTALEHTVGLGMPSIISCIPGELAYFESEQGYGAPPRYVLKRNA
ncbi:hypothetical protein [Priestia megaterium]|uniref:hypothetical protein n=1 Tax=Priestia megaterium TaxID=1404 RepID=UPI00188DC6FD|nr:hypothetical protein [Priestia megaterium]